MTADITIARGVNNSPCEVPVYDAFKDTPFTDIDKMPVTNAKTSKAGAENSILSRLPDINGYLDMEGTTVGMVTCIAGTQMYDVVELIGVKQSSYIVRIEGKDYAVRKSIARFIVKRD